MLDRASYDSDEIQVTFEYVSRSRIHAEKKLLPLHPEPPNREGWALVSTEVVDPGLMAFTWRKYS